jgi:hypothetical protein
MACELIDDFLKKAEIDRRKLEEKYVREWNRNFRNRIRRGRFLASLLTLPALSDLVLKLTISFPFLLRAIIKSTHGKTIKVPNS